MNIPERFKSLCSLFNQVSSDEILLDKKKYDICYDKMEAELNKLEIEYQELKNKKESKLTKKSCSNCQFYHISGECRRNPPTVIVIFYPNHDQHIPETYCPYPASDFLCGEWKIKEEK